MIIPAIALAGIIALSKIHNLFWIPVIGFLVGYYFANDPSYNFSNAFGGLTFSGLTCLIAGFWFQRQKKKRID
jgi:purine-cytosine permease-like protein